ncbi:MAG: 3-phosphoserine/phosphohydroxythreonine transaminase [Clostridiales bacterium]|nr:3-phosphoserine/phosphohydroxythreonine transaminase [Clostridiales bacterium]
MSEKRIYNFSPGPSMLPLEALEICSREMTNYQGSGMSVMEMSHRSKIFIQIFESTQNKLREMMSIPDNYKILFLQGGASTQFAMIPMNLMGLGKDNTADYAVTGYFAKKAAAEAKKYGQVNLAFNGEAESFARIPKQSELNLNPNASYFHLCTNNTIYGTLWDYIPETGNVPIVADMSSCILSEPVDVSKYGIIYAGAQKNMGPSGLTVVIIREDLVGKAFPFTPTMLDYETMVKNDSMYNTPTTYSIYVHGLVLDWLKSIGGLTGMQKINREKAKILYDALDESSMFVTTAEKASRSIMNVTFKTNSEELDAKFIKEATERNLCNLKGHRAVGGMRASIYNAMPVEGVVALAKFIKEFESKN